MSARRNIIPIFVPHAGCPNDCVFCNQKRISGSVIVATPEIVKKTLDKLPPKADMELAFYGGSFTAIPGAEQEALLQAAQPYLADDRISSIRVSTRPDAINSQAMDRLHRYGVTTVELGAQSMDELVLQMSGRGHTSSDTVIAARALKSDGFQLILQMMTGLPGSSENSDIETARELCGLCPDGMRIYPTVILMDTMLADLWRSGAYKEHTVEDAVRVCAQILPILESNGIPLIRLGLNPSDELSGGVVLGGAYHPALGELVLSRIWLEKGRTVLKDVAGMDHVTIGVPENRVSVMIGQHRSNVTLLESEYGINKLSVRGIPGLFCTVSVIEKVAKQP